MILNLNDVVWVRLNARGKQAHAENCAGLRAKITMRKPDKDGWTKWQLWELMQEFGPHLSLGASSVFENNEILTEQPNTQITGPQGPVNRNS